MLKEAVQAKYFLVIHTLKFRCEQIGLSLFCLTPLGKVKKSGCCFVHLIICLIMNLGLDNPVVEQVGIIVHCNLIMIEKHSV